MRKVFIAVLIFSITAISLGSISTNVPLAHWSYEAIERLADYGYTDSDLLSTRPITRLNMARLILEARERSDSSEDVGPVLSGMLHRLEDEYAVELEQLEWGHGTQNANLYVKPLEDPYTRYVYADKKPDLENEQGRQFQSGSNFLTGFASRGQPLKNMAFYLHPEYHSPSPEYNGLELIEGYVKLGLGPIEMEVGKDSLWWGPGYHGGLIMSSNVKPFEMIKISHPEPILLPGLFRKLGPIKGMFFLTELEKARNKPYTKLSGVRVTMNPSRTLKSDCRAPSCLAERETPRLTLKITSKSFGR